MPNVTESDLRGCTRTLLESMGVPPTNAEKTATSIVLANVKGHDSHGVIRLPMYNEMIDDGAIDPRADPRVDREDDTTAVVDGQSAFGHVVGRKAVELGVQKAKDHGVGVIGLRNGTHLGRVGEWAERAADRGMIFAAFFNTMGGATSVAPPGSAERRLSTNPLVFGVPTFDALEFPIVLDMATSQVANGKIREYRTDDRQLPDGWTITESGDSVTDPDEFFGGDTDMSTEQTGALLPLGGEVSGYKGFGLGIIAEFFASFVGDGIVQGQRDTDWFSNGAAFFFADPLRFTTERRAETRVEIFTEYLRSTDFSSDLSVGPAAQGDRYLLPGEPEYRSARRHRENGLSLPDGVAESLREFAAEMGVQNAIPASFDSP